MVWRYHSFSSYWIPVNRFYNPRLVNTHRCSPINVDAQKLMIADTEGNITTTASVRVGSVIKTVEDRVAIPIVSE